jgi:hypothetical protein
MLLTGCTAIQMICYHVYEHNLANNVVGQPWVLVACIYTRPILVAACSKAWVCGRSLGGIVGSNPVAEWMSIFCVCCVLSRRGLCVELITRPEESYRVWCV